MDSDSPLVLVQDYHFALAPRMIRERLPLSTIVAFWHIPWPDPRDFAICPWGRQLLEGLLGSSIVGFQTPDDCRNFIETVERSLGAHIDRAGDVITYDGRSTTVRAYPVSVEWPSRLASQSPDRRGVPRSRPPAACSCRRTSALGVGVDRLDYTKGINEKFLAVERLLELHPELRERFVFVQIAEPSRECLPAYRDLAIRLLETADRINAPLRHRRLPSDHPARSPSRTRGRLPVPAGSRRLLRRKSARRNEPGREGIRQRARR